MKIYKKQIILIIVLFTIITVGRSQSYMVVAGGNVYVEGDLVLNNINLINDGVFSSTGSVVVNGSMDTSVGGTTESSFNNLIVDKTSSNLLLDNSISVITNLDLTNGKILIQDNDITFEAAATISNFNETKYIVTEGLGRVVKTDLSTAFEFPVGFDQATYNPIQITQNGDLDAIAVRCLENVLEQGTTGNVFATGVVDASWEVSETIQGGSNLDIITQWDATDELTDFDRTISGISYRDATCWNMNNTDVGNAMGSDPYSQFRTGITNTGIFAVGNENLMTILLSPTVFLQGASLNPNVGEELLMRDDLRLDGLIPTISPYADALICDITVFNTTGDNAIVDWVWLEIRDSDDLNIVIESRSALLQRDGDIVAEDGLSEVKFTSLSNTYYVAVNHRNHLGVLSAISNQLAGSTSLDFSTNINDVYGGILALTLLTNGNYAINGGDVNNDTQILNGDINNVIPLLGTSAYSSADTDLDGQILNNDILIIITPNLGKGEQY
jgi:hypothetical protein